MLEKIEALESQLPKEEYYSEDEFMQEIGDWEVVSNLNKILELDALSTKQSQDNAHRTFFFVTKYILEKKGMQKEENYNNLESNFIADNIKLLNNVKQEIEK